MHRILPAALCLLSIFGTSTTVLAFERPERQDRSEHPFIGGPGFDVEKDSATDPAGDTFGSGPTQIDLSGLSANVVGTNLEIVLSFHGAIETPDGEGANVLDALIDLDVDQNGSTGGEAWTDALSGSATTGMGIEFYVDIAAFDSEDGTVSVLDDDEIQVGRAPVSFTGNSVTVLVPLTVIQDEGAVNVAAVVGTPDEPTDKAPNNGSVASGNPPGGDTTILLNGDRFRVSVQWSAPGFPEGPAFVSNLRTEDTGFFYFLDAENIEFLIKVLDGCVNNDHYWVFFAAATDVAFEVTVTDTQANETQIYTNDLGNPADAITDTFAFATCP